LSHYWQQFTQAHVGIIAVGQGSAARSKEFRAQLNLPFPMLADPRRTAYSAYGLLRVDLRREVSLSRLKHTVQATLAHGAAISTDQDMRQLGGIFVVGTDGMIHFAHRSLSVEDVPQPQQVLAAALKIAR
jgi:peroxiredoxin